jgi:hypothetical protein
VSLEEFTSAFAPGTLTNAGSVVLPKLQKGVSAMQESQGDLDLAGESMISLKSHD